MNLFIGPAVKANSGMHNRFHQNDGEWFLDTFNYALKIEGGIYI
jgi:hypothetical protein